MPVQPNNGKVHVSLGGPDDVETLMEVVRGVDPALAERHIPSQARVRADLQDYALFLSATNPEWFAPYVDEAIIELAHAWSPDLASACHLFRTATDDAVEAVAQRLESNPGNCDDLTRLAGIGSDHALNRFADHVRRHPAASEAANRAGMHVGSSGPAVRRFSPERFAIHREVGASDAVSGLPLESVRTSAATVVTWHNLSIRTSPIAATSAWPQAELHMVSPRTYWFELQGGVDEDGRLTDASVDDRGEPYDAHLFEAETKRARTPSDPVGHRLQRLDETHIYRNGHVSLTPRVVGIVGGCPIGLDPTPVCAVCDDLMFHAATIEERTYGEGFRSVAFCENCSRVGIVGSNWN